MKKSIVMLAIVLVALSSCDKNNSSSSSTTNSSGNSSTNSIVSSDISTNTSSNSSTSSSITTPVTYISQAALDSLSGSMKIVGSYKIDAVKYGSDYDYVGSTVQIYEDDLYYCLETSSGTKVQELNLFDDDGLASARYLTEKNQIAEELLEDSDGNYLFWEDFENKLTNLVVTDFVYQEDGTYLCVNDEVSKTIGHHLYGYNEDMAKVTMVVVDEKVVKIDFATKRYMYDGVMYQDSGTFIISEHGSAKVPTISVRETTEEHEILATALEKLGLNYTTEVYAEITPYGYNTSTGGYTYYFVDDYVYVDNGEEESESFGYYFDAGTLYQFGVSDGESYFVDSTEGVNGDLSAIAFDLTTFATEMFTYQGDGVYTVEDDFAPVIGSLISIDNYGGYSTKVTIKLNEQSELDYIQYDFYVDGSNGGSGFYKYTFKDVDKTISPITLDGLLKTVAIIEKIPESIKGKWTVNIGDTAKTIRISGKKVYIDTNQARLVNCDGETLVVSLDDELYSFKVVDNGNSITAELTYNSASYVLSKIDDSKWQYQTIKDFVGSDIIPAFTSGTNYGFGTSEAGDGSEILAIEVSGDNASTAWEDEYIVDLTVAGFVQDTSYDYDDGYGYIFVAPDSSCFVQFFYNATYNVFAIYVYNI